MHAHRTPLYQHHQKLDARFIEFAGWEMPLHYRAGAIEEHLACRNSAALFDISHMAQYRVDGRGAGDAIAAACSADVRTIAVGGSSYALLCREDGGVLDDMFVYRTGDDRFLIVGNAARRDVDAATLNARITGRDARFEDASDETAMLALQGPRAHLIVEALLGRNVAAIDRLGVMETRFERWPITVARTGYTGEDGVEIIIPNEGAEAIWRRIAETADAIGVALRAAGLAARDSLRLEAGFALYGHELTEEITPVEARLLWACDLEHAFVGRDAILARRDEPPRSMLTRLVMEERGVPREGYAVLTHDGMRCGTVVSGGRAPSVDGFIANAFVDRDAVRGGSISVEIHGSPRRARVIRGSAYRPSYRRLESSPILLEPSTDYTRRARPSVRRAGLFRQCHRFPAR
jgi:glycine cleavage system T protein